MDKKSHIAFLAEIRQEIDKTEARLAELRAVANYHSSKIEETPVPVDPPISPRIIDNALGGRFANARQVDAAAIVLKEAARPMRAMEIAKELAANGFPHKDIKLMKVALFTTMSRNDKFTKTGPGLWTLRE